jgi:energy-coupling factor transport system permease protein
LSYFGVILSFTMIYTHPFCLASSFLGAFIYLFYLRGKKALRTSLVIMLPMLLCAALINPAFNHKGVTILAYLPSGNPLTLESIIYGGAAALMLISMIMWFSCCGIVLNSDKLIYIFGRVMPALSLVLSMALRFAPRFKQQIYIIADAQKGIGRYLRQGNIVQRAKHGMGILSIMITWSLENAIETADSMKSRGYGLPGRTAFSIYRFERRDGGALIFIFACAAAIIAASVFGFMDFTYFPAIDVLWRDSRAAAVFAPYLALCAMPLIINIKEDIHWKYSVSKI